MRKKLLGFLIVVSLFFGFMWWDTYSGSKEFSNEMRKVVFNGTFVRSYDDPNQRSKTIVVFEDSGRQDFDAYYSALKNINLGDTLIKAGNTLKLVVRNGAKYNVHYPSYFGETFYDSTTSKK